MNRQRKLQRTRLVRQQRGEVEQVDQSRHVRKPDPAFQRGLAALLSGRPGLLTPVTAKAVQRHLSNTALQCLADKGSFPVALQTEHILDAERGHGQPLPDQVRRQMENAFGTDLGEVRVHTGGTAADLSRQLSSRAFTQGNDIYFSSGEYDPGSPAGQRILAHELTHVVQQRSGAKLVVGAVNDPAEQQADAVAERVVKAIRAETIRPAGQSIRRQLEEEEEEPLQALRRQVEEEEEGEELLQALRRQVEEEEEEELQALRRQVEEEEEGEELLQALRRQVKEEEEQAATSTTEAKEEPAKESRAEKPEQKETEAPVEKGEAASAKEAAEGAATKAEQAQAPGRQEETAPAQAARETGGAKALKARWAPKVVTPLRQAAKVLVGKGETLPKAKKAGRLLLQSLKGLDGFIAHYKNNAVVYSSLVSTYSTIMAILTSLRPHFRSVDSMKEIAAEMTKAAQELAKVASQL